MAKKHAPVEVKVKASAAAATVTGVVLALLGQYVFGGEVPDLVEGIVEPLVSGGVLGGITFGAGWWARHSPRQLRNVVDVDVEQ
ncbi:holin [Prauserella muralis]|uniref:Uncharacterized protein n=1 Tax=Prauserella muralis TaxID=588067 RepID=A0A2V4B0B7_9PSEU|nr:holin [Prauserella muralis]PXY27443.1 hypothetical protein BAY60_13495 [Prauserella muralis]TWE22856.1 hypothetical protein FHX69_4112 [Prauserella muralis]